MPLDMTNFEDDITLFLTTADCSLPDALRVIGDAKMDGRSAARLSRRAAKCIPHGKLKISRCWKNGAVFRDPAAPWLLTALAADLVSLRKQPLLALFSSEQEHFIKYHHPGSEDEYTG